jgi:hypothetical protein
MWVYFLGSHTATRLSSHTVGGFHTVKGLPVQSTPSNALEAFLIIEPATLRMLLVFYLRIEFGWYGLNGRDAAELEDV